MHAVALSRVRDAHARQHSFAVPHAAVKHELCAVRNAGQELVDVDVSAIGYADQAIHVLVELHAQVLPNIACVAREQRNLVRGNHGVRHRVYVQHVIVKVLDQAHAQQTAVGREEFDALLMGPREQRVPAPKQKHAQLKLHVLGPRLWIQREQGR